MRVKVVHTAAIFAALGFYSAATGLAQSPANKNAQPTEVAGWRVFMKQRNIPDNAFPLLKIRNETRPDGSQVAIVTNRSRSSLFYEGYVRPTNPRRFIEEFKEGRWVPTVWATCGTGLKEWKVKPGESRTLILLLPRSDKDKKTRHWSVFSNKSDGKKALMLLGEVGK